MFKKSAGVENSLQVHRGRTQQSYLGVDLNATNRLFTHKV